MKNEINLKRSLYALLVISLFAIIFISGLSYNNINNAKNLQQDIYINAFMPVSQSAEFKANMLEAKLNIEMLLRKGLNQSYIDKVNTITTENLDILKLYADRQLDVQEMALVKILNEANKLNNESIQSILNNISKGQLIDNKMIENYATTSDALDHAIDDAIDYAITDAETLNSDSALIAKNNVKNFLITIIVVLFVLILFVLTVIKRINRSMREIISSLEIISKGDLTVQIVSKDDSEFGKMKKALSKTVGNINEMIRSVGETATSVDTQATEVLLVSDQIKESTSRVTKSIGEVATGSNAQREAIEKINNYFSEFSLKISHIVDKIEDVNTNTDIINTKALQGSDEIKLLILSSDHLSRSFKEVSTRNEELSNNINAIRDITDLLNNISEQTNLLALNASIEAARAGESGRGFTIVASQIRTLAEQSKISSDNIGLLIEKIIKESNSVLKTTQLMNDEIEHQKKSIDNSIASFEGIIQSISETFPEIKEITVLSEIINKDKDKIVTNIEEIAHISEATSISTEEILVSSHEIDNLTLKVYDSSLLLERLSEKMKNNIDVFKY